MAADEQQHPEVDKQLRQAYRLHLASDLSGAIALYRQVLEHHSESPPAWHLWGLAEHQRGDHAQAIELLSRALQLAPGEAVYHNHLGAALQAGGRLDEALASFQRASLLAPAYYEAHANCSAVLESLGNHELAWEMLTRVQPPTEQRRTWLTRCARLLTQLDRSQEAIKLYKEELRNAPDDASLYFDLGNLYLGSDQATKAEQALSAATMRAPHLAEAWYNLGQAYVRQDRIALAEQAFQRASELAPARGVWRFQRHLLCPPVFESTAAIAAFHERFEGLIDAGAIDLSQLTLAELPSSGCRPPYSMNFHGQQTRGFKEKFAALVRPLYQTRPLPRRTGRPRIGFVITRGHEPLFLRCSGGIADRLSRNDYEVCIIASPASLPTLQRHLTNPQTQFIPLPDRIEAAIEVLLAAKCDVLYHWEVGSDDMNYLLPFAKAAPAQCTSWGTQVTSGVREVEYYLSSQWIETADADAHYTEKLWRLPSLPTYQYRIPPPEPIAKSYFGWSEQSHLYLCPQNLLKIHPDQDPLFQSILERDSQALIVLKELQYPAAGEQLRQRLERHLGALAKRIVFLPWLSRADYYRLVSVADVVLDAMHYSAGSSSYDMFSLDQPVVTLPTELNVGRYTQACYHRMGFTELIATDSDDYVRMAVRVAGDHDYRHSVRELLRERTDCLFEERAAVTSHEEFFAKAVSQARA